MFVFIVFDLGGVKRSRRRRGRERGGGGGRSIASICHAVIGLTVQMSKCVGGMERRERGVGRA